MPKYHIEKMACGGCEANIRMAIASIDPALDVEIDLPGKTVQFAAENPDEIEAALAAAGYPAQAIPS